MSEDESKLQQLLAEAGWVMRIGIAGPLGTPDIEHLLDGDTSVLPREMKGATLLVALITALIRQGHQVSAYTTDPSLIPRRQNRVVARGRDLSIFYVPRRRTGFRPDRGAPGRMLDFFRLERRALADAMCADRPDVVHAHWSYEFAAAALDTGLPCLVTCHDSPWAILKSQRDLYRVGRLFMAKSVLRRMRHATVVSPYLVEELSGMTHARLGVVPNPLPDSIFEVGRVRQSRDFRAHPPEIAMLLNGWSTRKNPEPGMAAMRLVRAAYPGARMHLFGPGFGAGEQASNWAAAHQMEDAFIFHGWTPYAETMERLASMDVLLHPAIEESFGMTIAEAMAMGVPVVAGKDSGAVPWVLGKEAAGGLLTDIRAPEQIAEALLSLLGDPGLYERCSAQGHARAVGQFSAAAVAHAYLEHYQRVIADATSVSLVSEAA